MPDSHDRTEKSDDANAQERTREALERGVAEIKTPEQARHALDSLEKIAGDLREEDVARAGSDAGPEQQAAAIEESGASSMFRADTARLLLDLAKAGIGPATRRSLHAMLRALSPEDRFGGMHELAWRLFLDTEDSEDGESSRTAQIRRDLRELKPARRKRFSASAAPGRSWTNAGSQR